MRTILILGAVLTVLSGPALAQYGGSGQSAGGPLGSYARRGGFHGGYAYGPYFGTYAAIAPVYFYAGPTFYGGHHPGYYGYPAYYGGYHPGYYVYRRRSSGAALAAGLVGGFALGALAARSFGYYPRRYDRRW
jgi:hypothetical protein